jgi:hypothetical protein
MSRSPSGDNDPTATFHRLVAGGTLQELRSAVLAGADLNAPGHCGKTALMATIEALALEKVELLVASGADPELTDDFNRTPLQCAVEYNFADGVRYLLDLGVDRGHRPRYPLKPINFSLPNIEVPLPAELQGIMSEAEWKESIEQTNQSMREHRLNPTAEPVIGYVQSVEVLKLLVAAGDDLNLAPREVKRLLVGLGNDVELSVAKRDYKRDKSPRFGTRNPEPMDVPFWHDMIRSGGNAYSARKKYDDLHCNGPVWCFDRFGSSLTPLGDGRYVQIAGEHEDHYDPDFYIYNDVVVHDGRGGYRIFGYPSEVFPPTDSHSATLVGDVIYIIGSIGYPLQRRSGFTPVYRLTLETWRIEEVATTGEMPGWIFKHRADYDADRNVIRITGGEVQTRAGDGEARMLPNEHRFELELERMQWRRIE